MSFNHREVKNTAHACEETKPTFLIRPDNLSVLLFAATQGSSKQRKDALYVLESALVAKNWDIDKPIKLHPGDLPTHPLSLAIEKNAKKLFRLMIKYNAQVNYFDSSGNSPLMLALMAPVTKGTDWCIPLLIKAGAIVEAPNKTGITAQIAASKRPETKPVAGSNIFTLQDLRAASKAQADEPQPVTQAEKDAALYKAVFKGDPKAIIDLLNNGANPNQVITGYGKKSSLFGSCVKDQRVEMQKYQQQIVNAFTKKNTSYIEDENSYASPLGAILQSLECRTQGSDRVSLALLRKVEATWGEGSDDFNPVAIATSLLIPYSLITLKKQGYSFQKKLNGKTPVEIALQKGSLISVATLILLGAETDIHLITETLKSSNISEEAARKFLDALKEEDSRSALLHWGLTRSGESADIDHLLLFVALGGVPSNHFIKIRGMSSKCKVQETIMLPQYALMSCMKPNSKISLFKLASYIHKLFSEKLIDFEKVHPKQSKSTLLHAIATCTRQDILEKLLPMALSFTNNPNQKDAKGETALNIACRQKSEFAINALLGHRNIEISGFSGTEFRALLVPKVYASHFFENFIPALNKQNNKESIFYRYLLAHYCLRNLASLSRKKTPESEEDRLLMINAIVSLTKSSEVCNMKEIPMNETLLESAIKLKVYSIIQILLKHGAMPHARDNNNDTLHWLAQHQEGFPEDLLKTMTDNMPSKYRKKKKKNKKKSTKARTNQNQPNTHEQRNTVPAWAAALDEQRKSEQKTLITGKFEEFLANEEIDNQTKTDATAFFSNWKTQPKPQFDKLDEKLIYFQEQSQRIHTEKKQQRKELGDIREIVSATYTDTQLLETISGCKRKIETFSALLKENVTFSEDNKGRHLARKAQDSIDSMSNILNEADKIKKSISEKIEQCEIAANTNEIRQSKKQIKEKLKEFASLVKTLPKKMDISKKKIGDFKAGLKKFNAGNKTRPKQRTVKHKPKKQHTQPKHAATPSIEAIEAKLGRPSRAKTLISLLAALCKWREPYLASNSFLDNIQAHTMQVYGLIKIIGFLYEDTFFQKPTHLHATKQVQSREARLLLTKYIELCFSFLLTGEPSIIKAVNESVKDITSSLAAAIQRQSFAVTRHSQNISDTEINALLKVVSFCDDPLQNGYFVLNRPIDLSRLKLIKKLNEMTAHLHAASPFFEKRQAKLFNQQRKMVEEILAPLICECYDAMKSKKIVSIEYRHASHKLFSNGEIPTTHSTPFQLEQQRTLTVLIAACGTHVETSNGKKQDRLTVFMHECRHIKNRLAHDTVDKFSLNDLEKLCKMAKAIMGNKEVDLSPHNAVFTAALK